MDFTFNFIKYYFKKKSKLRLITEINNECQ